MLNKLKCFLPALLIFITGAKPVSLPRLQRMALTKETTLIVGSRSSDSTGMVTISNAQVQSGIINTVPLLVGMKITPDQPYIMATPITAYIIFKTTHSNNKQFIVAVELAVTNTTLSFGSANGREVHICKASGNCTGCGFIKMGKRIISCTCDQNSSTTQAESSCHHTATWLH